MPTNVPSALGRNPLWLAPLVALCLVQCRAADVNRPDERPQAAVGAEPSSAPGQEALETLVERGRSLLAGDRAPEDAACAARLFEQACAGGLAQGCFWLGHLSVDGVGAPQDDGRARRLYEQACEGGISRACRSAGLMHREGVGVEKNLARARELFERSCETGDLRGCALVGELGFRFRSGVDADRTREVLERACGGGDMFGCYLLAKRHDSGYTAPGEEPQTIPLLQRACEGGEVSACDELAGRYAVTGLGVPHDDAAARRLWEQLCALGRLGACYRLTYLYEEGLGGEKDVARAVRLVKDLCADDAPACATDRLGKRYYSGLHDRSGYVCSYPYRYRSVDAACNYLGQLHYEGKKAEQDYVRARTLFERTCALGFTRSCRLLGRIYEKGLGVEADPARAKGLYRKACEDGLDSACREADAL